MANLQSIFNESGLQGIIPYGAQLLIAAGFAGVSSIQIMPYLFYPYLLFVCVLAATFFGKKEK